MVSPQLARASAILDNIADGLTMGQYTTDDLQRWYQWTHGEVCDLIEQYKIDREAWPQRSSLRAYQSGVHQLRSVQSQLTQVNLHIEAAANGGYGGYGSYAPRRRRRSSWLSWFV